MKNIYTNSKKWVSENRLITFTLLCIFVAGVFLRISGLNENLLFGMEQGRDAIKASDIYSLKDIVLIGPKTDIDGVFHGVWYYYLVALLYFVAMGNPLTVVSILAAINCLTIFVVYAIAREMDIRKPIALVASSLAAVSFNVVVYSRWLSNVSPSIFVVACFILSLVLLIKRKKDIYWIPTFIFYALLFHFELLHGLYASFVILIITHAFRLPILSKNWWRGAILFFLINVPFIIFDVKNQFILSKGIIHYISTSGSTSRPYTTIALFFDGLFYEIASTFQTKLGALPFSLFFVFLVGIFSNPKSRTNVTVQVVSIFLLWSFPYVLLLKLQPLEQFYAGTSIAIILLFSMGLELASKSIRPIFIYIFSTILIFGMGAATYNNTNSIDDVFYHRVQKTMIYRDQRDLVEYVFSKGSDFEWDAFTIPYYHSDAYRYLFFWMGKQYPPKDNSKKVSRYYLIIEPSTKGYWLDQWIIEKDQFSNLISEQKFGDIILQERLKK